MTGAAWVAAIGTAGALLAAVYTLWRQIQADVRSEAHKIYITLYQEDQGRRSWSIENGSNLAVELKDIRAIFHHDESIIGDKVRPSIGDGWSFTRKSGLITNLRRAWVFVWGGIKKRKILKIIPIGTTMELAYSDEKTMGVWTTLRREAKPSLLKPNKKIDFPVPWCDEDVGVALKVGFTDSNGRSWWRIYPTSELRSAWDPEFWSIRRNLYVCRVIAIMPLILLALALTATVEFWPGWAIASSIVLGISLLAGYRAVRFLRKLPPRYQELPPLDNPEDFLLAIGVDSTGCGLAISSVHAYLYTPTGALFTVFQVRNIGQQTVGDGNLAFLPVFVTSDGSRFNYDATNSVLPGPLQPGESAPAMASFDTYAITGEFSLRTNDQAEQVLVRTTLHRPERTTPY